MVERRRPPCVAAGLATPAASHAYLAAAAATASSRAFDDARAARCARAPWERSTDCMPPPSPRSTACHTSPRCCARAADPPPSQVAALALLRDAFAHPPNLLAFVSDEGGVGFSHSCCAPSAAATAPSSASLKTTPSAAAASAGHHGAQEEDEEEAVGALALELAAAAGDRVAPRVARCAARRTSHASLRRSSAAAPPSSPGRPNCSAPRRRAALGRADPLPLRSLSVHPALCGARRQRAVRRRVTLPTLPCGRPPPRCRRRRGRRRRTTTTTTPSFVAPLLPSHMMSLLRDLRASAKSTPSLPTSPPPICAGARPNARGSSRGRCASCARSSPPSPPRAPPPPASSAPRAKTCRSSTHRRRSNGSRPAARRRDHRRRHLRALPGPRRRCSALKDADGLIRLLIDELESRDADAVGNGRAG